MGMLLTSGVLMGIVVGIENIGRLNRLVIEYWMPRTLGVRRATINVRRTLEVRRT